MEIQTLVRQLGSWSAGKGSLQVKLARALMGAIRQGELHPGLRLPSERNLALALTVSRTTVVAAYDALRDAGWVESRAGSGTRVRSGSALISAARHSAHESVLAGSPLLGLLNHYDDSDDAVDFAVGTPMALDLPAELFTLPSHEYAALLQDRLYHPLGLETLRGAVAEHYTHGGLPTRPDQVLVTNGSQQAIALCAALFLQRGDTALVEDPTYFGALDAFRAAGARISSLAVETEGVAPGAIRERIRATAARLIYLTPTFQNPTGTVMPASARRELGRIAIETGVAVIDDRTMAELVLEGTHPPPLAAFAPEAAIITIGSLSKLMWPGLRIGWIRAAEPLIERLARLKSAMDLGSPLITQAIGVRLMGKIERAREMRRLELKPRRDLLASLLQEKLPGFEFEVPSGGLFLWVKLPFGDSRRLAQVALRHGLAILPGPSMSAAEEHSGFLRLPFLAEPEVLREAVERLRAAWRDFASMNQAPGRQAVAVV
jgi:DNA-binding transcriptional MocR family regulator